MAKAHFTAEADQDLDRIAAYIASDNPSAAYRWIDEMRDACELLAAQPEIGQQINTRRFGKVRRQVCGNYLIYYRSLAGEAQILRVTHGARDQPRLL